MIISQEAAERDSQMNAARGYITEHDKRVIKLDRMRVAALRELYHTVANDNGMRLIYGGPVTKDEFIGAIIELEFPEIVQMRETYINLKTFPGGC